VEEHGGGEPAGELAVEPDVCGVEGVGDADFGGDGLPGFVDAETEEPGVGVGVDESGGDVEAGGVDGLECDAVEVIVEMIAFEYAVDFAASDNHGCIF